ncbi:MAG: DUF1579 domain-containing protein [Candidatus Latescibacterota bacterium]|nr:MAG: DUF1579 domain-containing protein [Candidatus Latescibacterota bacterium]
MKKVMFLVTVGLITAVLVSSFAVAGQEKTAGEKAKEHGQPSPEEMAAWQKAATPGPHHKLYKDMVGMWNAECTYWMQPGAEPQVAPLKAEFKMLFGDRYLVQTIEGEMMGMPFKGMGISGYDNLKGVHTMVWIDNMSTATMYSEGECAENCTVETHHSVHKDAMTGMDQKVKTVSRIIDKDKHVFEYYMVDPSGGEFKSMEITYTRM